MRWIALCFLMMTGCAGSQVRRITASYCNGVPVVSVDFVMTERNAGTKGCQHVADAKCFIDKGE